MKSLTAVVTGVLLAAAVWSTLTGCKRRVEPSRVKEESGQETSQSTESRGKDLQDIRFEILHEKEVEVNLGNSGRLMLVMVLLQERLTEEELLSFVRQMYESYRAYENVTINVVASRAAYEEWTKCINGAAFDGEAMDKDFVVQCTRMYPPLDDTLFSGILKNSGTPRTDGSEYLCWRKNAVDGRKNGVVTSVDGKTVLLDPKDWNVKCESMGCDVQWSWAVDTPGRVGIRGKAINLSLVASVPTLRVSVRDAGGTVVSKSEFELPRFKGMRQFETCVLAYSFPWDLRDGQTLELSVVEPSTRKPEPEPQPDPNLPQTKVEATPVLYETAEAVKNAIKKDSGIGYTLFEGPKVGICIKQLDRNPRYKTIETWEVQLIIRIDQHLFSPSTPDTVTYRMRVEVEHADPQAYLRREDGVILGKDQAFVYQSEPSSHVNYAASMRSEWGWIELSYALLKSVTEDGLTVRIGGSQEFARTLIIPRYYVDGFLKFADEKIIPYASGGNGPS